MSSDNPVYDVIVVGGGPGGSTVSTLVAKQGHRVLLLEKETFPRYQIGESLLPSTVHGICRMLGVTKELEDANFMVKRGGTLLWGSNPEPWTFSFSISSKFSGAGATAFQVERMKFDKILLDNARRNGVDVRERCSVLDVVEDESGRVCGVTYTDPDGAQREARARIVVDASGNKSRIHSRVHSKRVYSEFFRNLALFGYYRGGRRLPAPNRGNILGVAFEHGWFWYIPLTDDLTSVGAVLLPDALDRVQGDKEAALNGFIEDCPMIAEYLADAHRVTSGTYGEIRVRKDYSYSREKFWRPGLVLIGDAACFIDPVFSSGVHLATYSGLLSARSINSVLAGTVDETASFDEFERRYRKEFALFHDFLVAFYDMHQDEQSYFWKAKKVTNSTADHFESFVELVGGGASADTALFEAGYVESRQDAFQELSDIVEKRETGTGEEPDLFQSSLVKPILKGGANIQVQAALGSNADEHTPMFEGGLVSSDDGMHWAVPTRS
ncbi:FAD-dependent oxidoreductase [Actinomadura sp. KC06]|uniref:tryptophan 7-halogenase n=1 Tax=Actinomadura sp. KC06 TaxID=2530369 RepID=UPI001053B07C|nr:tryptophan 7-halogenase [Actinomadura sp. KC06]TDD33889.1 FAD-dependent oxidoreductase [Actinomadura sp. KC06]